MGTGRPSNLTEDYAVSKWATFCAQLCCYDMSFSLVFSFSILFSFDVISCLKKSEKMVKLYILQFYSFRLVTVRLLFSLKQNLNSSVHFWVVTETHNYRPKGKKIEFLFAEEPLAS